MIVGPGRLRRIDASWPRSPDQEPINVGDEDYDPLYPYGYGLRGGKRPDAAPARG